MKKYSFWGQTKNSNQETIININAKNMNHVKEICKEEKITICSKISKL